MDAFSYSSNGFMEAAKKKILVVGTGLIGEHHTRCILATNRAEVSICEIDDNLRKKIANNYKIKNSYADFTLALEAGHDAIKRDRKGQAAFIL